MKNILSLALVVAFATATAQQTPINSIYNKNRILFNPANTGDQEALAGFINQRNQWVGNSGAPVSQWVGLHSPLTERVMLGGTIINFKQGLFRQTQAQLNYAYNLPINTEHQLYFGVGAILQQNSINLAEAVVEDPSEYGLMADVNGFGFDASFGVRYTFRDLEVGVALPSLVPSNVNRIHPNDDPFNQNRFQLSAHASYTYEFDNNLALQPLVVSRVLPNATYIVDNWLIADYKNVIWLGAGYRTQTGGGIMATVGTWLTKNINFNYAYEYTNNPYGALSAATHELSLGMLFSDAQTENPFTSLMRTDKPVRVQKEKMPKAKKSKSTAKKKITIITEGYDKNDPTAPELQLKVTPTDADKNSGSGSDAYNSELEVIKRKLDILLGNDQMSKSQLKGELNETNKQLMRLMEENQSGDSEEVAKQLEQISGKLKMLEQKINKM